MSIALLAKRAIQTYSTLYVEYVYKNSFVEIHHKQITTDWPQGELNINGTSGLPFA